MTETNKDDESISRAQMGTMVDIPPEEENIESTLVIPNEDGRFGIEMLFTLHDEFDIEQFSCKGIKRPSHDPIDVEPVTGQGHARGDDHAPYRAQSEGGIVDDDAKIVPCGWICVGCVFEDKVRDGDVCEWLEESGEYPHPEWV